MALENDARGSAFQLKHEHGINIEEAQVSTFTSRLRLLAFLLLLSSILTGCSVATLGTMGYERYYPGEPKPLSDIAMVVTITESMGTQTSCWIDSIDGKQAKREKWGQISFPSVRELNPGKHSICTTFQKIVSHGNTFTGPMSTKCKKTSLDAKPGHVYLIYPKIKVFNNSWEPISWDITDELHSRELKNLVSEIDETLAKNRKAKPSVSILSLSTKQSVAPVIGFGEKRKSNLERWLNKNITVSYKFRRYEPIFIAKADNGVEYHLEIDQQTGNIINVFGKNVTVERGFNPAFQPLNSKFAYSYNLNRATMPEWEEQKEGSFIRTK